MVQNLEAMVSSTPSQNRKAKELNTQVVLLGNAIPIELNPRTKLCISALLCLNFLKSRDGICLEMSAGNENKKSRSLCWGAQEGNLLKRIETIALYNYRIA